MRRRTGTHSWALGLAVVVTIVLGLGWTIAVGLAPSTAVSISAEDEDGAPAADPAPEPAPEPDPDPATSSEPSAEPSAELNAAQLAKMAAERTDPPQRERSPASRSLSTSVTLGRGRKMKRCSRSPCWASLPPVICTLERSCSGTTGVVQTGCCQEKASDRAKAHLLQAASSTAQLGSRMSWANDANCCGCSVTISPMSPCGKLRRRRTK